MQKQVNANGKVCIVTGSNSGIGKATARGLAELGATVVMACRNQAQGVAVRDQLIAQTGNPAVDLLLCDLAAQPSIRCFVDDFRRKYSRLDVLINNAANFDLSLKKPALTEDGVEMIFATNHLGPFLMTNLLLETLKASAPARIINVASKGLLTFPFLNIEFDNLNGEKKFSATHAYYHSKLAQVMFTYDLAQRLDGSGVAVNCIRVTNVKLDTGRYEYVPKLLRAMYAVKRSLAITPEAMAKTYIYLATSPEVGGVTGKYYDENRREVRSSGRSYDARVWERLWQVSAQLTHLT
ncbi:MAG TPA: SDR family oxidoreductase [Anaerolineae bacterium]|nr:SDR family oxidoreductase [Anaerolineae bacterium]